MRLCRVPRLWVLPVAVLAMFLPLLAWAQFATRSYLLQSAATSTANGTSANVAGYTMATVQVVIPTGNSPTYTITFEQSLNDNHYVATPCVPLTQTGGVTQTTTTSALTGGFFRCNVAGSVWFRARISAYTGPGAVTAYAVISAAGSHVAGLTRDPTLAEAMP